MKLVNILTKAIDPKVLDEIADLTDSNLRLEAYLLVTEKILKNRNFAKRLKALIQLMNTHSGGLSPNSSLSNYNREQYETLMKLLKSEGKEVYNEVSSRL